MKHPRLTLFLTFDHELPLGGVKTSWDDALFTPTNELFSIAKELDVPVTLFTDVLCALKFRKWDDKGFYQPYTAQLKEAVQSGHDVQLHLHPHWLTSDFDGKRFIPSKDYSLSDFLNDKKANSIDSIISQGIQFLTETLNPSFPEYKCNAFRAGGYNLGDSESRPAILKGLYDHGIRFDSSIAKGYYFSSGLSVVDYRNMPGKANWHLSPDGDLTKDSNSGILEIPIASIPKSVFEIPTLFKMKKYAYRAPLGRGYQIHEGKPGSFRNKLRSFMSTRMLGFDNYTYNPQYLIKILDYNIRKYKNEESVMMSIVGHPKTMGKYAWDMMRYFVKTVRTKYPETIFSTFSQIKQ